MKTNYLFISSIIALFFSDCCNDVVELNDVQVKQTESQDGVFIYDMYFNSEVTSYDGTTRAAMSGEWEDGDVVYLYFHEPNYVSGKAEYISASKKWMVTCESPLMDATNAVCSVWCGTGENPIPGRDYRYFPTIGFTYMTEAYVADSGIYTISNNSIYVNAFMKPKGWRLRFKGEAGTTIKVESSFGLYHFYEFGIKFEPLFYIKDFPFYLTVGSNGYTDYFVGRTEEICANIIIQNQNTKDIFYRNFDCNTLLEGESGCFTIPTSSNLHGWTKKTIIDGHECEDLGLPSGTLWATCNIGTSSPYGDGDYFAWGEIERKNRYDVHTYSFFDETKEEYISLGQDIAGTIYDVAHMKWGGSWQMPSYDQIQELIDFCTTENIWFGGRQGTLVTGPNGNSIFLPDAGGQFDASWWYTDYGYWSSISSGEMERLKFKAYDGEIKIDYDLPAVGMPVRAVCKISSSN